MTRDQKYDVFVGAFAVAVLAAMVIFLAQGCAVKGFQYVDDGLATPWQLRASAQVARSEADALDAIADENEALISKALASLANGMESIGGPGVPLAALIGAAGGLFIPSPGSKKRERALVEDKK
jgi:hypothetical protein